MPGDARPLVPPVGLPPGLLLTLLLLPPVAVLGVRSRRYLRYVWRRAPPPVSRTLEHLHRDFRAALERLVPASGLREGDQLTDALRAAGVEQAVAAHAARIRDRLRHAVYGPGGPGDADELAAETQEILKALTGEDGQTVGRSNGQLFRGGADRSTVGMGS